MIFFLINRRKTLIIEIFENFSFETLYFLENRAQSFFVWRYVFSQNFGHKYNRILEPKIQVLARDSGGSLLS